nr:MAG TPA: hypothetical protein [Caudoviricetes sp.]
MQQDGENGGTPGRWVTAQNQTRLGTRTPQRPNGCNDI